MMEEEMNCEGGESLSMKMSTTDHFLNQFQAKISQMKSAMDAVQSEILLSGGSGKKLVKGRKTSNVPISAPLSYEVNRAPIGRPSVCYQSQISGSNGLKMKIRKSPNYNSKKKVVRTKKHGKKRKNRKYKSDEEISDSDDDISQSKVACSEGVGWPETDQFCEKSPSRWGDDVPENILFRIFSYVVEEDGCVPFLVRASRICKLWRKVAMNNSLWTHVDLTNSKVKDKYKTERNLVYLVQNRLQEVRWLNLGGWDSAVTPGAIKVFTKDCKKLESLGLSSCQKLTGTDLKTITDSCPNLKKLDLSAIASSYNSKAAVSPSAICEAAEALGSRLTSLSLASNCLANFPQILTALAEFCHNMEMLDLSNISSPRRDVILIKIEQLQLGCPKLRILRLANSDVLLSNEVSLKDQVTAPGFPELEELSIAVDPKSSSQGMDNGDLERILKASKKLKLLDVRGCSRISDSGIVRVPAWDLEHLFLSGCFATKSSDDGLELIVRKWRHSFVEIDFSWTTSDVAINLALKALVETDDSNFSPPVSVLNLCGSSVSFENVKSALNKCKNIEKLNLTSCRALPRGMKRNYQNFQEVAALRLQVLQGKFDDTAND